MTISHEDLTDLARDLPVETMLARALEHLLAECVHSTADEGEVALALQQVYPGMERPVAEAIAYRFVELVDETEPEDLHEVFTVQMCVEDLPEGRA